MQQLQLRRAAGAAGWQACQCQPHASRGARRQTCRPESYQGREAAVEQRGPAASIGQRLAPSLAAAGNGAHPLGSGVSSSNGVEVFPPSSAGTEPLIVTTFKWPCALGGHEVAVAGSFNNWGPPLPLGRTPSGDFVRSLALPAAGVQFKVCWAVAAARFLVYQTALHAGALFSISCSFNCSRQLC